jgi:hypothetical protein
VSLQCEIWVGCRGHEDVLLGTVDGENIVGDPERRAVRKYGLDLRRVVTSASKPVGDDVHVQEIRYSFSREDDYRQALANGRKVEAGQVLGPYWINYVGSEIHVCGRSSKIIQRYPADTGEAAARAQLQSLQGDPKPAPPPRPTKAQADVLRRAREGIQFRAPALIGVFVECSERGWIATDPTEYGLHVTLTAAGMAVAP